MTADGVIGLNGKIPWHYSADLRRFKQLTLNSTVIMGRKTWESLPRKPLPERQNIVVTSTSHPNTDHYADLVQALKNAQYEDVWIIGGAALYREAINYCTVLDITYVPDEIKDESAIRFPEIDWSRWTAGPKIQFQENEHLFRQQFTLRQT